MVVAHVSMVSIATIKLKNFIKTTLKHKESVFRGYNTIHKHPTNYNPVKLYLINVSLSLKDLKCKL